MTATAFVKQDNGQGESVQASGRIFGREKRSRLLPWKKVAVIWHLVLATSKTVRVVVTTPSGTR